MVADALYCICVQVTIECWTRLPAWMLRPRQSAHLCVLPAPVTSVPAAEHWPSARGGGHLLADAAYWPLAGIAW